MDTPIYLDHNASAPLDARVRAAMEPFLGEVFGNSRSGHAHGVRVKAAIEAARAQVAAFIGAEPDEIVFTGGGSEANNLAVKGFAWGNPDRRRLVRSALEHYSIAHACDFLARWGWEATVVGVDAAGRLDLAALDAALGPDVALVAVQHANNEIGTVQDLPAVAARAHAAGAVLLGDAAQSAGKLPIDVGAMGVDLLTLAGHKFGGPQGIGALYRRRGIALEPLVHGAGHEDGLRSGTHPVALIVGLGAACALAGRDLAEASARMRRLQDRLLAAIRAGYADVVVNGHPTERLPHTLNVSFPGLDGTDLLAAVPGVAATTGAACHSGLREPSMALQAIGAPRAVGLGAVRLSLGRGTTEADVDRAGALLAAAAAGLAKTAAR
jgi:cysteine desulfurase